MSLQTRLQLAEDLAKCTRCGLSLLRIREHLRATVDVVRREVPAERVEAVVEELRRIWT